MNNIALALQQWVLCLSYPSGNHGFWMVINRGQQELFYGKSSTDYMYRIIFGVKK